MKDFREIKIGYKAYEKKQCQTNGFTIIELIVFVIVLALFYFGFIKGTEFIPPWNGLWSVILRLAVGIASGSLLVLVFIFSCMGIGNFLDKRKKQKQ